ncbi:hypothetical protein OH77DRAFT_1416914 [Trametes cingulata]|nr:hypothetical protein OH77DRAFT_1416914 [Trametes cingulata]
MGQLQSSTTRTPPEGPDPNSAPGSAPLQTPQSRATRRSRPRQPARGPRRERHVDNTNRSGDYTPGEDSSFTNEPGPTSVADLRAVRAIFSRLGLPAELIFQIMDEAEYYPSVRATSLEAGLGPGTQVSASIHCPKSRNCAARLCLLSSPIPGGETPEGTVKVKKVVWTIESHDQGWGGEHPGTFHGAYSWFDACIFRPVSPPGDDTKTVDGEHSAGSDWVIHSLDELPGLRSCDVADVKTFLDPIGYALVPHGPSTQDESPENFAWLVQRNRAAVRTFTQYRVEWRPGHALDPVEAQENGRGTGDGFVESLLPGDRVGLWMRALYPGWVNVLRRASVEVFYDVY